MRKHVGSQSDRAFSPTRRSVVASAQLRRGEKGATIVEAVFALPLLMIIMIVGFDLIRTAFSYVSLQYVAEQTVRQAALATTSASDAQAYFISEAQKYGLTVDATNIGLCPKDQAPCYGSVNVGAPGDRLQLDVSVPVDGFLMGAYSLLSRFHFHLAAGSTTVREFPA